MMRDCPSPLSPPDHRPGDSSRPRDSGLHAVGSSMVFESVFREHRSRVTRTLASLGVQSAFVEDAVQDVFLIVYEKLPDFEGRAQLKTWIYAVTYRVAQNYRRHLKLRTHEPFEDLSTCTDPNPAERLENQQAARYVESFCATLSEAKRDVFVLCILEERCVPEVSELLNLNLNTVYSRARTVRLEFRQALSNLNRREERKR
jgi:RNA polymerase sigma-70 factor (ECF subfamily)